MRSITWIKMLAAYGLLLRIELEEGRS